MTFPLTPVALGRSDLRVAPICLGTMTFGEQVDSALAHRILDRALERDVTFLDTAEMYAVPARADTFGATETIIGQWLASRPGARQRVVLATKVAGPSRGMPWIRGDQSGLSRAEIVSACDASLQRLQTDVIDLYQLHWPARNVPMFGGNNFDPSLDAPCASMTEQLEALSGLVMSGKVRAVGLSNESPYGVHEFVRLAEQHSLPTAVSVQNAYNLLNRSHENGMDETCHRLGVSLLAYSPLAFGLLTGKYDKPGLTGAAVANSRMFLYERFRQQRWGRPMSVQAAAQYNALAQAHGLTPTAMALAFCYRNWRVASTIIGVTTLAQLDACIDAWDVTLSPELIEAIDAIRWTHRDPAQ